MGSIMKADDAEEEYEAPDSPQQLRQLRRFKIITQVLRDHLTRLPLDVLRLLFLMLDPVEATCLGLTCKASYAMFKYMYRDPIRLDTPWDGEAQGRPIILYGLLRDWAGERYRPFRRYSASGPPRLIFKKLPGKEENSKDPPE